MVWLVLTSAAFAQAPQSATRFDISGYAVEGAPLLRSEGFSRIVSPFIGKQKTAADVQKAQQAVQQAYLDLGHCSVQVTVPKVEPDAGIVTLKLVQSPLPVSKDCLPMVVLDDKRAPQVRVAPGEVAVRPFTDVTQAVPETPTLSETPSPITRAPLKPLQDRPVAAGAETPAAPAQVARAPLKPLQDRPVAAAPAAPPPLASKPEIASAPAPREAPADITVKSLAEAAPQPGLIVTPTVPALVEKPLATAPAAPPVAVATAPESPQPKPKSELALALAQQPVLSVPVPQPTPKVEPSAVATTVAPKAEVTPVEIAQTVRVKPATTPMTPAPTPAPIAAAPVAPVSPPVVSIEPAPPAAVIATAPQPESAPAPKPKPIIEPVREPVAVNAEIPKGQEAKPVIVEVERPLEKTAPDVIAAAPVQPQPAPAPHIAETMPPVAEPIKPAPALVAQPVIEPVREQVAAKPDIAPVQAAKSIVAERPLEKPAPPDVVAVAPVKSEPAKRDATLVPSAPSVGTSEPTAAPRVVEAMPVVPVEPVKPAPVPMAPPVIEPVKEQLAAKPEAAPLQATKPVVAEKPIEKPAPDVVAAEQEKPAAAVAPRMVEAAPVVPVRPMKPAPAVVAEVEQPSLPAQIIAAPPPKVEVQQVVKPEPSPPIPPVVEKSVVSPTPAIAAPPKPVEEPAVASAVPAQKVEAQPAEKTAVAPVEETVVVRPLTGAVAPPPEPPEPAEIKPEGARAPVRPLQDRPSASALAEAAQPAVKPAIAAVPEAKPAPLATPDVAPRVAETTEKKPEAKPAPVVVQAPAAPAPTEPATPVESTAATAALKFDIDRYLIEGNTLLNADAIGKVLRGYTGKQKDFADVQRALEALQIAYQKAGWGAVQVTLPEQELERGEVRFEVIETRLGNIEVQGNAYFSEANVRRSVPSLKPGETPNSLAMSRSLKVANENPAKQSQVSLKAGSKDGEVDATIKVVDDNPRKYSVSMDNTGTSNTGRFRLGFGFQHANLWDRDHQLTLQYITNPEHVNKVTVLGLGYHIPLYGRGDSVDFILGYSDVDSGTVQQLFNVSGAGLIALGRYNQNLDRIGDYEHKLTYGIDYKAFSNKVLTTSGVPLVPDITLHPVSVAYSGIWRKDRSDLNFYASLAYNAFEGGNDAAQSDFRASRGSSGGASAEYVIWRYGATYTRLLPDDWTLRLVANGQTTRNALVAGEQFGIGGANSVRGFNERTYSNDKGYQATVEAYTPDIAGKLGLAGARLKLLAFYDTGALGRNFLQTGEQTGLSIDSIGLGLRLSFRENFSMRVDYAQVLHDGGQDASLRDGRRNSNTLHASAILVY